MFYRCFPLMDVFHVDWLSRRHQFSLIMVFAAADRMVSPTCIMLPLSFFILLLIGSVCNNSCVEVFQNIIPGDKESYHSSVGDPIIRLYEDYLAFTNTFWSTPSGGGVAYFSCFVFLNASA